METIAERLKMLRAKAGYSQQFVAEHLGIERTTYVKWESGASKPNKKIAELAKLFNVSSDYLLMGEDNKQELNEKQIIAEKELNNIKREKAQQAYDLLMQMPPTMQKTAIAQLKALADLNK